MYTEARCAFYFLLCHTVMLCECSVCLFLLDDGQWNIYLELDHQLYICVYHWRL